MTNLFEEVKKNEKFTERILIFDMGPTSYDEHSNRYINSMVNEINEFIQPLQSRVEYVSNWLVNNGRIFLVGILLLSTSHAAKEILLRQRRTIFNLRECDIWFHACCVRDEELLSLPQQEIENAIGKHTVIKKVCEENYIEQDQQSSEICTQELALLSLARMFQKNLRVFLIDHDNHNPFSYQETVGVFLSSFPILSFMFIYIVVFVFFVVFVVL